ncbi:MAG: imidazoleglycerol-phosphate dehydratase, partial [Acidimicrobiales bacterium]
MTPATGPAPRRAERSRRTRETTIEVTLVLDGSGAGEIGTGLPFFDHMLAQLARHGSWDLT